MAKKTPFKKPTSAGLRITKTDWEKLGDNAAVRLRNEIREKKFFKNVAYTPEYKKRKAAGKAGKKGVSVSSKSTVPDLTNSGKTLNSIRRFKATDKSVIIGPGTIFTQIALGNAENGRSITDPKLGKILTKEMEKDILRLQKSRLGKGQRVRIKIG